MKSIKTIMIIGICTVGSFYVAAECPTERANLQSCLSQQQNLNSTMSQHSNEIESLRDRVTLGTAEEELYRCEQNVDSAQRDSENIHADLTDAQYDNDRINNKTRRFQRRVGDIGRYERRQFKYFECVVVDQRYALTAVGTSTRSERKAIKDARDKAKAKWGKVVDVNRLFERAKNWFDDDEYESFCFKIYKTQEEQDGPVSEWNDQDDGQKGPGKRRQRKNRRHS